eukprot:scaffold2449_cov340-Prasinococcus_capsulatus_cf.AAC.2
MAVRRARAQTERKAEATWLFGRRPISRIRVYRSVAHTRSPLSPASRISVENVWWLGSAPGVRSIRSHAARACPDRHEDTPSNFRAAPPLVSSHETLTLLTSCARAAAQIAILKLRVLGCRSRCTRKEGMPPAARVLAGCARAAGDGAQECKHRVHIAAAPKGVHERIVAGDIHLRGEAAGGCVEVRARQHRLAALAAH